MVATRVAPHSPGNHRALSRCRSSCRFPAPHSMSRARAETALSAASSSLKQPVGKTRVRSPFAPREIDQRGFDFLDADFVRQQLKVLAHCGLNGRCAEAGTTAEADRANARWTAPQA